MNRDLLIALAAAIALHAAAAAVLPWLDVSAPRRASATPASFTVTLTAETVTRPVRRIADPEPARAPVPVSLPASRPAVVSTPMLAPLATPPPTHRMAPMTTPIPSPAPTPISAPSRPAAGPAPAITPLPLAVPAQVFETAAPVPRAGEEKTRIAPAVTYDPPPAYPQSARRRGWTGVVDLRVRILASGRCGRVEMTRSSGHAVLDRAAERAVKRWRFEPGTIGGRPAEMWIELPIEFRIEH